MLEKYSVFSAKNNFPVMKFQKFDDLVFENGTCKTWKNNSRIKLPQESILQNSLSAQELRGTQWKCCKEYTWWRESK